MVHTRLVGIYEFPFNRRARKERAGSRDVNLELLLVFWNRLAGFQLDHMNAQ